MKKDMSGRVSKEFGLGIICPIDLIGNDLEEKSVMTSP